jgi:hypothetical protein
LTGIQLAEAEANPGPAGQHQGDDASAPPQDDAPASFGYRPDYKFQTIKWFISKVRLCQHIPAIYHRPQLLSP